MRTWLMITAADGTTRRIWLLPASTPDTTDLVAQLVGEAKDAAGVPGDWYDRDGEHWMVQLAFGDVPAGLESVPVVDWSERS